MSSRLVVVCDASNAHSHDVRRTAESLLASTVKPSHWLVLGTSIEHERITRMRTMRRSGISVAREIVPLPSDSIVVFLRLGNALTEHALADLQAAFADPETQVVYGDSLHGAPRRFENDAEVRRPGGINRWSGGRDQAWHALRPVRVAEVAYDQFEGDRLRHVATWLRWRPDRTPESCSYAQAPVYEAVDIGALLRPPS